MRVAWWVWCSLMVLTSSGALMQLPFVCVVLVTPVAWCRAAAGKVLVMDRRVANRCFASTLLYAVARD